ncbi:hypothetical protein COCON_G00198500 [Conger conger]|uniref:Uncharacterized protein n=1 Tax=Conger conger TaxID=82655 RepID=A0A9Q1D1L0_CONCO|nr:hypothetical protein COCON_G00198500 [Conger conger]
MDEMKQQETNTRQTISTISIKVASHPPQNSDDWFFITRVWTLQISDIHQQANTADQRCPPTSQQRSFEIN